MVKRDIWKGIIRHRGLRSWVLFWTADEWKLYSNHNVGCFLKDIGFNVAVLLTNLSEHMPHDTRLQSFLELADSVLNYFQPYLGRIEIMGSAKRIERVYFEISESSRTQWEKPQVMEHKLFFPTSLRFTVNNLYSHNFPGQRVQASVHLWCG